MSMNLFCNDSTVIMPTLKKRNAINLNGNFSNSVDNGPMSTCDGL